MRKSANDFSTTGENKNKTNKLHLATCYLNHSQLQFHLFFFFFVKCWSYRWTRLSICIAQGQTWLGKGARQIPVRKAIPGANASWLYRKMVTGWCFPLVDDLLIVKVMLQGAQTRLMVRELMRVRREP